MAGGWIKGSRLKSDRSKGFSLTVSALIIALVMVSAAFALRSVVVPMSGAGCSDPRVQAQAQESLIEELLRAQSKGYDPQQYLQNLSSSPISTLFGSVPSSVNASAAPPAPVAVPPGVLVKVANGTGSPQYITFQAPPGSMVVIADANYVIKAIGTVPPGAASATVSIPGVVNGTVIAYPPPSVGSVWNYTGTVNTKYTYAVQPAPPLITALAWTPPQGFPYIVVKNPPPLSLVQLSVSSASSSVVSDPRSAQAYVPTSGMTLPATGSIVVRGAGAWLQTTVKGGDVYTYAP